MTAVVNRLTAKVNTGIAIVTKVIVKRVKGILKMATAVVDRVIASTVLALVKSDS